MNTRINLAPNGVMYLTFKLFENAGLKHGFSTRVGGVSTGIFKSMNLSFNRNDNQESVLKNHKRFAEAVGYDYKKCVFSDQIHETHIVHVTEKDCGRGMRGIDGDTGEKGMPGADGLITDEPGIPLMTFYADCVPLFFYDPVKKVIAAAHSGWRGTVKGIGKIMVDRLVSDNGCKRENILSVIGPSICRNCYEVSEDVVQCFEAAYSTSVTGLFTEDKGGGKYLLDLWEANRYILESAGLLKEHIEMPDICTCHNPEIMISHRQTGGKRGNMAGVLVL